MAVNSSDPNYISKALIMQYLSGASDTSPVRSWSQGAARLVQGLMGGLMANQDRQEQMAGVAWNPLVAGAPTADASPASAPPMGNRVSAALAAPGGAYTPPEMPVEGGGTVPLPPPRPVMNRNQFVNEANDPAMAQRLATIAQGEVGRGASPEQKQVLLESILNRATARGQSLADVTQQYTGPGSKGYYPQSTFTGGSASPQETADFQKNILASALRGTDTSSAALGFPATGNASGTVASNGIANGRYSQSAMLGPETFVQQPGGREDIARLEASRLPPVAGALAGQPPTQLAGPPPTSDSSAALPQGAQPAQQVAAQPQPQPQQQAVPSNVIDKMEVAVDRALRDPNPYIRQQAQAYKQYIIQHRLEQSLKYGPEAVRGTEDLAAAGARGKQGVELSPQGIAGQAMLAGAKAEAESPSKILEKGSPTYEDKIKTEQQNQAKTNLSNTVGRMADNIISLDKMGGLVNTEKGVGSNLNATYQELTQKGRMAFGTKDASLRAQIEQDQPALINAIRQATNMGARGLDSNVELSFYMKQTGSGDINTRLAALDKLDKAYGLGIGIKGKVPEDVYNKITHSQAQLGDQFSKSQKSGGEDPLGIR